MKDFSYDFKLIEDITKRMRQEIDMDCMLIETLIGKMNHDNKATEHIAKKVSEALEVISELNAYLSEELKGAMKPVKNYVQQIHDILCIIALQVNERKTE